MSAEQIARGADLTADDIAVLTKDAVDVTIWCWRNRIKRPRMDDEVRKALEARLGRRPLVTEEST